MYTCIKQPVIINFSNSDQSKAPSGENCLDVTGLVQQMRTGAFLTPQETEVHRGSVLRRIGSILSVAVLLLLARNFHVRLCKLIQKDCFGDES